VAPSLSATRHEEWTGRCVTVAQIEREVASLRAEAMDLRTSVMTHVAWAPPEWQDAARETLAGLAERHPSRTLLLFPEPDGDDGLAARVLLECYEAPGSARHLCNEVVELRLRGARAQAPASIALPLVLPDLPIFLRWRGRPDFGASDFEQLADMVDRLVVDSSEWPDVPVAYRELAGVFDRVAVSDIAWRRTLPWRAALSAGWPDLPERIAAPPAEAALVAGWLKSRADHDVLADESDKVPFASDVDASDLLSDELDVFGRDPVYEAAVTTSVGLP
jgi:Glucose-6-phosphate dehydrogenase subunit